jgi:DNA-binding CsgD family transcriptional regulator
MDPTALFDHDAAQAVFGLLARLYGGDRGPPPHHPASAEPAGAGAPASRVPDETVLEAQQSAECEAARALLDRLPFGIVVVDARRRLHLTNAAGTRILAERTFLGCDDDTLTAACEGSELHDLVRRAGERQPWPVEGIAVQLRRPDGGRPVRVLSLAMPAGVLPEPALVLLLPDEARTHAVRRLFVSIFGLTPAEAHIAVLMASGLTLAEAASERGIAISTARGQWQTVIWKVGGGADAPLLGLLRSALTFPLPAGSGR